MSYNLIYNGEFTQPIISTASFIYSTRFTTVQRNIFYWRCGVYTAIQNGNTAFAFLDSILTKKIYIQVIYHNHLQ